MKRKQSWSIFIICFNEEASISRVHADVQRILPKISSPNHEIILIDDGSSDGTAEMIREIGKRFPKVRALFHKKNLGIGMAIRTGIFNAKYENVCMIPGDGQFDPRELLPYGSVQSKTFISFFRKSRPGYSRFRNMLSKINKGINRFLLGIQLEDVNWVKVYKRDELLKLSPALKSSMIESEICAKLIMQGNECIQVPSIYHQRTGGKAKGASFKTIWKALKETYRLIREVKNYKKMINSSAS